MRVKSPVCAYCESKMNRIYCLKPGVKTWVSVGWSCPIHKLPNMDKIEFADMGLGYPGSPSCPACNEPMKALYSKINGRNQLKRIRGMYACFNGHVPSTIPASPILQEEITLLAERFSLNINDNASKKFFESVLEDFDNLYGKGSSMPLRRLWESRTLTEYILSLSGMHGDKVSKVKILYSDGDTGDYVLPVDLIREITGTERQIENKGIKARLMGYGFTVRDTDNDQYWESALFSDYIAYVLMGSPFLSGQIKMNIPEKYLSVKNIMSSIDTLYGYNLFLGYFYELERGIIKLPDERKEALRKNLRKLIDNGFKASSLHLLKWI